MKYKVQILGRRCGSVVLWCAVSTRQSLERLGSPLKQSFRDSSSVFLSPRSTWEHQPCASKAKHRAWPSTTIRILDCRPSRRRNPGLHKQSCRRDPAEPYSTETQSGTTGRCGLVRVCVSIGFPCACFVCHLFPLRLLVFLMSCRRVSGDCCS